MSSVIVEVAVKISNIFNFQNYGVSVLVAWHLLVQVVKIVAFRTAATKYILTMSNPGGRVLTLTKVGNLEVQVITSVAVRFNAVISLTGCTNAPFCGDVLP